LENTKVKEVLVLENYLWEDFEKPNVGKSYTNLV